MKKTVFFLSMAALAFTGLAGAQEVAPQRPSHDGQTRPERASAEQAAQRKTDEMNALLGLTKKQYRKIYKLNLSEEQNRNSETPKGMPQGRFSGGPGPEGMRSGGQRPPMKGGQGRPDGMPGAGRPGDGMPRPDPHSDEYIEAREKKLKKILSAEQYAKWCKANPDPFGVFDNAQWQRDPHRNSN